MLFFNYYFYNENERYPFEVPEAVSAVSPRMVILNFEEMDGRTDGQTALQGGPEAATAAAAAFVIDGNDKNNSSNVALCKWYSDCNATRAGNCVGFSTGQNNECNASHYIMQCTMV